MKTRITEESIRTHILSLQDEKYKTFHAGLVPGEERMIGVRVPVLRSYARELCRQWSDDVELLLETVGDDYYEEIMLQGMIIGMQKKPEQEQLFAWIRSFVPKINNWAVCDTFCAGLKEVKRYRRQTYDFLQQYFDSGDEYAVRFAVVMLLDYYVTEEYIEKILKKTEEITHDGYYVKMAVAWLLSICLVKFYDRTRLFLEHCRLEDFTYNKALQKARESYRISPEQKAQLQDMKRS